MRRDRNELHKEQSAVKWYGYVVLIIGILSFSGLFKTIFGGALKMLDFQTLLGSFGKMGEAVSGEAVFASDFRGIGGTGVKGGFLMAFSIVPTEMFALGVVAVIENYGGLQAARKLLTPLLKPLIGVNGSAGLTVISSLQSTDAGAGMTADLHTQGLISNRERNILGAFQFAAGATLANYFVIGAAFFPLLEEAAVGTALILVLIFSAKIFAANVIRFAERKNLEQMSAAIATAASIHEAQQRKPFMEAFASGAAKGWRLAVSSTIPNVMLAITVVYFLELAGVLDVVSAVFTPIMAIAGLPGSAAAVFFSALLSGSGASGTAYALYLAGELTARQCAVLFPAAVIMTGSVQYLGRVLHAAETDKKYDLPCFLLNILLGFLAMVIMRVVYLR